jgi:hypothetical protein
MSTTDASHTEHEQAIMAIVRRNTEVVQGQGDFALFEELFADDFVDRTPQPGTTPDKDGVRVLYHRLREAFPDFRPEIGWQSVDGDIVTTFKTYHGTHLGTFLEPVLRRAATRRAHRELSCHPSNRLEHPRTGSTPSSRSLPAATGLVAHDRRSEQQNIFCAQQR